MSRMDINLKRSGIYVRVKKTESLHRAVFKKCKLFT